MAQALGKNLLQACGTRYIASNLETPAQLRSRRFQENKQGLQVAGLVRGVLVQDLGESDRSQTGNTVDDLDDLDLT